MASSSSRAPKRSTPNNDDGTIRLWRYVILELGFEREALLGPEGKSPILGRYGLGYGPEAMESLAW